MKKQEKEKEEVRVKKQNKITKNLIICHTHYITHALGSFVPGEFLKVYICFSKRLVNHEAFMIGIN